MREESPVFRRGPDLIARGSVKLLLDQVMLDEREALYQNLCRIARGEAGLAKVLDLTEAIGDRTEGRPVQMTQSVSKRTTIFQRDLGEPGEKPRELTAGAARQVEAPPEVISPLDGQRLVALTPMTCPRCQHENPSQAHSPAATPWG